MADSSTLVSESGRSLLADSSVLDSKVVENSKENVFPGSVVDVEGDVRSLRPTFYNDWLLCGC